jgi:hypothetical protein
MALRCSNVVPESNDGSCPVACTSTHVRSVSRCGSNDRLESSKTFAGERDAMERITEKGMEDALKILQAI